MLFKSGCCLNNDVSHRGLFSGVSCKNVVLQLVIYARIILSYFVPERGVSHLRSRSYGSNEQQSTGAKEAELNGYYLVLIRKLQKPFQ